MEAARKFIQTVRLILAGAVVMYAFIALRFPSSATPNPIILRALTVLAVSLVVAVFVMRRIQVLPVETALEKEPQDTKALGRWRQGYLVTYTLSLSIALYGLVLHFFGFPGRQVAPFFLAGLALILFFSPRVVPGHSVKSGPITPG